MDVHAAFDSHTYGSQWVHVRNDGKTPSQDSWVLAGDLVYVFENVGHDGTAAGAGKPYTPVGYAMGSQTKLILASEAMMKAVGYEARRVIPVHEERLKNVFPSRITKNGLRINEICLAAGQPSMVA